MRLFGLFALVWIILSGANDARAQAFLCTEAVAGQLSEQAGVQCECKFFHASAMAGTPAGYRWDCGILRPRVRRFTVVPPVAYTPFLFYPSIAVTPSVPRPAVR